MKRSALLAVLAIAALASPALADQTLTIQDQHGAGSDAPALAVDTVSCTWDEGHFVSVQGQLQNISSSALAGEQPQLIVRDGEGEVVARSDGYADVPTLAPKQRSHFGAAARLADKDDTPVKCELDFLDSNSSPLAWRDDALGG